MRTVKELWQKNKKEIKYHTLGIVGALLIIFGVFLFWSQYKVMWFCDEFYSYFTANSAYAVGPRLEYGKWYDSQFVVDDFTTEHGRYFFRTRHNVRTDDHPPIYFYTMHLFSFLMRGNISKWVGLWINLICILGITFFSYWILYILTRERKWGVLGAIALGILPSTLTNAMLIRMYCMVTMWALIFLWLTILLMRDCVQNKYVRYAVYGVLSLVTAIGFLTHYYFAIYAVGITLFFGIKELYHKKWEGILAYLASMIIGVELATWIWPDWISQLFFQYCGEEVFSQAQNFSAIPKEMWFGISSIFQLMFYKGYLVAMIATVVALVFLMVKKDKLGSIIAIILGTGVFYGILVAHVTPSYYLDYRYFYMIVAVTYIGELLLVARCVRYIPEAVQAKCGYGVLAAIIVFNILVAAFDEMSMGYVDRSKTFDLHRDELAEYKDIPWVVYGYENWTLMTTYYDLALGSQFIVYTDGDFMQECPCKGEDYLFMFNNSFEYTEDELIEYLRNMEGCKHEIEYVTGAGSATYHIHHLQ